MRLRAKALQRAGAEIAGWGEKETGDREIRSIIFFSELITPN